MKRVSLIAGLVLVAGCGGNDPTPDVDEAASPAAIEASVNEAKDDAADADNAAEANGISTK